MAFPEGRGSVAVLQGRLLPRRRATRSPVFSAIRRKVVSLPPATVAKFSSPWSRWSKRTNPRLALRPSAPASVASSNGRTPENARTKRVSSRQGSIVMPSIRIHSTSSTVGRMSSRLSTLLEVVPNRDTVPPGTRMSPFPGGRRWLITPLEIRVLEMIRVPLE